MKDELHPRLWSAQQHWFSLKDKAKAGRLSRAGVSSDGPRFQE
jgi:hypothetical protein